MVTIIRILAIQAIIALAASGCNIEVGNPEGEPAGALGRSLQSLSMSLKNQGTCDASTVHCATAPVTGGEASNVQLSMEMHSAQLTLGAVTLKPFAAETTMTSVDLISGAVVNLSEARDSAVVSGIALQFESTQAPTLRISGYLTGISGGTKISIPLEVVNRETFSAEISVSSGPDRIEGILFDAATWFDFSAPGMNLSLRPLIDGACRDAEAPACTAYKENLAHFISQKVSRSMTVKTTPASKKMNQGAQ